MDCFVAIIIPVEEYRKHKETSQADLRAYFVRDRDGEKGKQGVYLRGSRSKQEHDTVLGHLGVGFWWVGVGGGKLRLVIPMATSPLLPHRVTLKIK